MTIRVASLHIYPIKACGGITLDASALEARGLCFDRRWMVIEDDGRSPALFVTQRELPPLALIQPRLTDEALALNAPGMWELRLPLQHDGASREVIVWRDTCRGIDAGDQAANWLSTFLGVSVRLVRMADDFVRPVDSKYAVDPAQVGFADGYPLLLASTASLDDLNTRLEARGKIRLPMNRFRPNLVVEGGAPFEEDTWRQIRVGEIVFDVVKPCARCKTTTVDQAAGAVPDPEEPLATLATFRRGAAGGVMFGQNIIHRGGGRLETGMGVEILD